MKRFVSGLLFLLSFNSFADVVCHDLSYQFSYINSGYSDAFGAIDSDKYVNDCKRIASVSNVFSATAQLAIDAGLSVEQNLGLTLVDSLDNAGYGLVEFLIPLQFKRGEYTKHPKFTKAIWSHEFSHSIFSASMPQYNRFYRDFNNAEKSVAFKRAISREAKGLGRQIERMTNESSIDYLELTRFNRQVKHSRNYWRQVIAESNSIEEKSALTKKIEKLNALEKLVHENIRLIKYSSEFMRDIDSLMDLNIHVKPIFTAFNEFFADLVAILTLGDHKAVVDSLTFTGSIDNAKKSDVKYIDFHVQSRDFSDRANEFNRWNLQEENVFDFYTYLAPARYHAYKYYIDNPNYHNNPEFLLNRIFTAMVKSFEQLTKHHDGIPSIALKMEYAYGDIDMMNKLVKSLNREFIQNIDNAFAE